MTTNMSEAVALAGDSPSKVGAMANAVAVADPARKRRRDRIV